MHTHMWYIINIDRYSMYMRAASAFCIKIHTNFSCKCFACSRIVRVWGAHQVNLLPNIQSNVHIYEWMWAAQVWADARWKRHILWKRERENDWITRAAERTYCKSYKIIEGFVMTRACFCRRHSVSATICMCIKCQHKYL